MILTKERTEEQIRPIVDEYLAQTIGPEYFAGRAKIRADGSWGFRVLCKRADMQRVPMVGYISVDAATNQVQELTDDQIREMCEAGAVQAANQGERGLARGKDGFVLRRQARIKAKSWTSHHIGMKIGAEGGTLLLQDDPVWRFSVVCYVRDIEVDSLGIIDVDAQTGQVRSLTDDQIQAIQEAVSAAIRHQKLATAG